MKRYPKMPMADKIHRGAVLACIGLTAYGTFLLGLRVYRFYTVGKPAAEMRALQMIQEKSSSTAEQIDSTQAIKA